MSEDEVMVVMEGMWRCCEQFVRDSGTVTEGQVIECPHCKALIVFQDKVWRYQL